MGIYGSVPTLLPADVAALNTAIFKGVFNMPAISQFHRVENGIKANTRVPVLAEFNGLLGSIQDECDVAVDAGSIPISAKNWDPKYLSGRVTMCYTDLMGSFWQWLAGGGLSKENLQNTTAFATFAAEMLASALLKSIYRVAWFSDTAAVAGTGNSISAGNLKYFTAINGFWKQAVTILTANPTRRQTITKNSGATDVLQAFDATDTTNQVVTGYLTEAHNNADFNFRALNNSDKIFICTDSIVTQLKREYKKASGIDMAYNRVEDGIDTVTCDGIEVVPFAFLDVIIKGYFRNGANTASVLPHRFILTTKGALANLMIGTINQSDFSNLEQDYDKKAKEWYVDYGYDIDALIGVDDFISGGY